jgi:hypothetical protein
MRDANRLLGVVAGSGFLVLGVLGLLAGVGSFGAADDTLLFGLLGGNTLQGILHVLLGAALLIAALSGPAAAATVNSIAGGLMLILGGAGLFLVGSEVNVLALTVADNVVHFAASTVLLAAGLGARNPAVAPVNE